MGIIIISHCHKRRLIKIYKIVNATYYHKQRVNILPLIVERDSGHKLGINSRIEINWTKWTFLRKFSKVKYFFKVSGPKNF